MGKHRAPRKVTTKRAFSTRNITEKEILQERRPNVTSLRNITDIKQLKIPIINTAFIIYTISQNTGNIKL